METVLADSRKNRKILDDFFRWHECHAIVTRPPGRRKGGLVSSRGDGFSRQKTPGTMCLGLNTLFQAPNTLFLLFSQ